MPNERKPRYRRLADVRFALQPRDLDIINLVHTNRFLSSEHIRASVSGSDQGILRRLSLLFHAGYLDRPPEQIKPYRQGSDPMVYALGNKGADLLAKEFGISRGKIDWTSKNREVKRLYLDHTLSVAHFMTCLRVACMKDRSVKMIEQAQLLEKTPIGSSRQLKWKVPLTRNTKGHTKTFNLSLAPDKVFGLHFPNDPAGKNRAYFFLEVDRSTMPVKRRDLFKSSYFKKMLFYWTSWRDQYFEKHFGFQNARVLTLAKSQDRIETMIQSCRDVDDRRKGSRMFLFAPLTAFNLNRPGTVFQRVWQNARGEMVSILD